MGCNEDPHGSLVSSLQTLLIYSHKLLTVSKVY